jgi:hypothetical protein
MNVTIIGTLIYYIFMKKLLGFHLLIEHLKMNYLND